MTKLSLTVKTGDVTSGTKHVTGVSRVKEVGSKFVTWTIFHLCLVVDQNLTTSACTAKPTRSSQNDKSGGATKMAIKLIFFSKSLLS